MSEREGGSQSCSNGGGGDSTSNADSISQGVALTARMKASSNNDVVTIVNTGIYYIPAFEQVTITTSDHPVSIHRAHVNLGH